MATDQEPPTSPSASHAAAAEAPRANDPEPAPPAGGEAATPDAIPTEAAAGDDPRPKPAELVHPRSLVVALLAAVLLFALVAQNGQFRFSVPLGLALLLSGITALFDALGTFDPRADHEPVSALALPLPVVARPLGFLVIAGVAFGASLALGQANFLPPIVAGAAVFGTYVGMLAGVFAAGKALGVFDAGVADANGALYDAARPLHRRYGFWLLVLAGALFFPTLGMFSLSDPWETHYGEVAREILARDDWISLWWAQDDWFWSKPILNFWIQALAMSALFTHYQPGHMLDGHGGPGFAHPEWVVRAPNVLLTLLAMYVLYRAVSKAFGRRAGFLGGFVLATSPDWYFLAHQTMTDMPFVAPLTAAMGFLMLGLHTPEGERVRTYSVRAFGRTLHVSAWHLLFLGILLCAVPQILYLFSRNLELHLFGAGKRGLLAHFDRFEFGSAGNCGLPGNKACHAAVPATAPHAGRSAVLRFVLGGEPAVQGLVWTTLVGALLAWNVGERRRQRLYYLAAWMFAAIATMGKGPAGLALPALCTLLYLLSTKRFGELMRLEILSGILVVLVVAMPWFVAMYVRHGSQFTDRLIFHDMWKRALEHVHDTNEGDDTSFRFYVWQLGYALFPWSGLAPLGLLAWMKSAAGKNRGADGATFLFMWFLFAFALFTLMGTKFHHYIFPAVPPLAMLVGVVLDELLGSTSKADARRDARVAVLGSAGALAAAIGIVAWLGGSWFGWAPGPGRNVALAAGSLAVGAVLLIVAARSVAKAPLAAPGRSVLLGGGVLAGAFAIALIGRDLFLPGKGAEAPGAIRYLHLFTYNYKRPWPESLDFTAALTALTVVAVVLSMLMAFAPLRRMATLSLLGLAALAAVWGEDVYFLKTAPHWGQHEVIEAYYKDRKSEDQWLVAYQMNWKGENFYTGNRVPAFVSSGASFTDWLKKEKEKGAKVMYFVTEHSRVGGLRSEVQGKSYTELTDKRICNKFVLVRAEL